MHPDRVLIKRSTVGTIVAGRWNDAEDNQRSRSVLHSEKHYGNSVLQATLPGVKMS